MTEKELVSFRMMLSMASTEKLSAADVVQLATKTEMVINHLITQRDQLRETLEDMVSMVEMNGFGKAYAMEIARAALAETRGRDEN